MKLVARFGILPVLCWVAHAQSPLERAVTLTREKHYAEARQSLQGVSEPAAIPQRIAFHRLKAAIAAGLNDSAVASAEMRQALQLAPGDPALLLATAVAESTANQLDAALSHAAAVESSPIGKALSGDIQERLGAFPEAVTAYREAIKLDPGKEDYRASLAFSLIRHQAFKEAIDDLRDAIPLFPRSSRLRTLLGIAQYAGGETEDAVATLSDAITADRAAQPAYRSLTQIVLQSSAAPEPRIVAQLCEWNATVCGAMKLRLAREQNDTTLLNEAARFLEQLPATDVIARCELARAREWTSRLPEARIEMEKCVASDPTPLNHFRLGLLYQRLRLPDLAKQQMELRSRILTAMSEQTANGLSALATLAR